MESWISVDKTSGSDNAQIKVTTSVNEGADRKTTVTIRTSGGKTASVFVHKLEKDIHLTLRMVPLLKVLWLNQVVLMKIS